MHREVQILFCDSRDFVLVDIKRVLRDCDINSSYLYSIYHQLDINDRIATKFVYLGFSFDCYIVELKFLREFGTLLLQSFDYSFNENFLDRLGLLARNGAARSGADGYQRPRRTRRGRSPGGCLVGRSAAEGRQGSPAKEQDRI